MAQKCFAAGPQWVAWRTASTKADLHAVEREHLETGHALPGKQLARRRPLPEPIKLAIRLHPGDAAALPRPFRGALAARVKAAESNARQANIGLSGTVLGLALTKEGREYRAARLAQGDGVRGVPVRLYEIRPYGVTTEAPTGGAAEALAELAAGAAHELNNPLSVIAGRTAEVRSQQHSPANRLAFVPDLPKLGPRREKYVVCTTISGRISFVYWHIRWK